MIGLVVALAITAIVITAAFAAAAVLRSELNSPALGARAGEGHNLPVGAEGRPRLRHGHEDGLAARVFLQKLNRADGEEETLVET